MKFIQQRVVALPGQTIGGWWLVVGHPHSLLIHISVGLFLLTECTAALPPHNEYTSPANTLSEKLSSGGKNSSF